jgi:hypothetical protein
MAENDMDRNTVMHMWDEQRAAIANGDKSSSPRDWFESLLDALEEETNESVLEEREACRNRTQRYIKACTEIARMLEARSAPAD